MIIGRIITTILIMIIRIITMLVTMMIDQEQKIVKNKFGLIYFLEKTQLQKLVDIF